MKNNREIVIYRNDYGWHFKFWIFKIYFNDANTLLFNDMVKQQIGYNNDNNLTLKLFVVLNIHNLAVNWNPNVQYYQITKMYQQRLFDIPWFDADWFYCNELDMNKSEKNVYLIKTGVNLKSSNKNKTHNIPINFSLLFRYKLTGSFKITKSIYIKL